MFFDIFMMRKIGMRIRQRRESQGCSREELARLSKCSREYIGRIERAERVPSLPYLFKIADCLGTSPAELLVDTKPGPNRDDVKRKIQDLLDEL